MGTIMFLFGKEPDWEYEVLVCLFQFCRPKRKGDCIYA